MSTSPKPLTRIAIIDVADVDAWTEALPGCAVFSFKRGEAPTTAPGADVAVLRPADDDERAQVRLKEIIASLHGAAPYPARLRVVNSHSEILNDGGRVIPAPRVKVVQINRREEAEQRRAQALAPIAFQSLTSVTAADYKPKIPLFESDTGMGILFAGAHLIVGRPKIGKSWLLLQMALAASEGTSFLGMRPRREKVEVLMICAEDDKARIKGRLEALGVGRAPENCYVVTYEDFQRIAATRGQYQSFADFIDQTLTERPLMKLIIIDTETSCRQIWAGESKAEGGKRATDVDYEQTRAFDAVALKHNAVLGLVNHASKRKGEWTDIHELINRTNTALAGASGSVVLADLPDADPLDTSGRQRILGARGRDMKDDLLLCVKQETDLPMFVSLGEFQAVQQTQAEEALLQALEEITNEEHSDGYVSLFDIAEVCGKQQKAVQRCLNRMLKRTGGNLWKGYRVEVRRGRNGGAKLVAR